MFWHSRNLSKFPFSLPLEKGVIICFLTIWKDCRNSAFWQFNLQNSTARSHYVAKNKAGKLTCPSQLDIPLIEENQLSFAVIDWGFSIQFTHFCHFTSSLCILCSNSQKQTFQFLWRPVRCISFSPKERTKFSKCKMAVMNSWCFSMLQCCKVSFQCIAYTPFVPFPRNTWHLAIHPEKLHFQNGLLLGTHGRG